MIDSLQKLHYIDSFKNKVSQKKIEECSIWLEENNLTKLEQNKKLLIKVLNISRITDSISGLLCLRCRVSLAIYKSISYLYQTHKSQHEVDYLNMMQLVLDDQGQRKLREVGNNIFKRKFREIKFNWNNISKVDKYSLRPFSAFVIVDFNPELSNIDTWTSHKVKSNKELKSYLRFHGVQLQSAWSLLSEQSQKRIKEAWLLYGDSSITLDEVLNLHYSFVQNYKTAKKLYKEKHNRIIGWNPDINFLQLLNPKQNNTKKLELIEKAIRKFISVKEGAPSNLSQFESLTSAELLQVSMQKYNDGEDLREKNINLIRDVVQKSAFKIFSEVISQESKKWNSNVDRKLAWKLYAQGLSQRDIAIKCNHKQGWVSKLIREKVLLERVSLLAVTNLKNYSEFKVLKEDPNKIDNLLIAVQSYVLSKEPSSGDSILKSVLKEVLNK